MLSSVYKNDESQFEEQKGLLSVAVIGPNDRCREEVIRALPRSMVFLSLPFTSYPPVSKIPSIVALGYDILFVDIDSDPKCALNLIGEISKQSSATLVAVSDKTSTDLVIRCMRAGAREFLTLPLKQEQIAGVLEQAADQKGTKVLSEFGRLGRLCVFLGAKGGAGTTTIASNFALAAAQESQKRVLLIDMDLPLGDAVLNFGLKAEYSTADALENCDRLDPNLLSRYLVTHPSGVSILAAPGRFVATLSSKDVVDRLLKVARQGFECVVVDAGCRFDLADTALFGEHAQIYLVLQVTIADIRNASRIVSERLASRAMKLDLILNRCSSRSTIAIDDEELAKALNQAPTWRIPNDYAAVCKMQTTATPTAMQESAIVREIRTMARAGLELPSDVGGKRKKRLGLF